jgi:hypothetical protein
MRDLLEASDAALAQSLWNRRGAVCTMCKVVMPDGYCTDELCETYPASSGVVFIGKFKAAVSHVYDNFKKRISLKPVHAKTISGGRVESKRRKH